MVTMPGVDDWQLLGDSDEANQALTNELNAVLNEVLTTAKRGGFTPLRLAESLFPKIEHLDNEHPNFGILDTEAREAMASFFADNFDPATYHYVRWWQKDPF